jgi:hypothetical protein
MANPKLTKAKQVAAVREILESGDQTLDQIAESRPDLAKGVEAVRAEQAKQSSESAEPASSGSGSGRGRGSGSIGFAPERIAVPLP